MSGKKHRQYIDVNAESKRRKKKGSAKPYLVLGVVCFVLLVAYIIMSILHPIGVVEYLKSAYYTTGSGDGYDIDLNGSKPIYTTGDDDRYYVVSANSVDCFNRKGKTVFQRSHSFSNPVVKTSESRYLLFGQGERTLYVSDFSKTLYTHDFQSGIITADISDAGVYAVVSKSDGYSSVVTVFSKKSEKLFEWFSSDEVINEVSVSRNGNYIAVSTLKVVDGKYVSCLYVLNFDSADPVYKRVYNDDIIYRLFSTDSNSFCVVLPDNIEFVNFKKGELVSYKTDYSVNLIKQIDSKIIAVRSVAANQDESVVEVYNDDGVLEISFNADNYISDFSYKSNRLYLLGLHDVYKYDLDGQLLSTAQADYDLLFIEAISSNDVAFVKNSSITKNTLSQTEE